MLRSELIFWINVNYYSKKKSGIRRYNSIQVFTFISNDFSLSVYNQIQMKMISDIFNDIYIFVHGIIETLNTYNSNITERQDDIGFTYNFYKS